MTMIDEIIAKKPHLEAPLRFYEKSMRFIEAVQGLGMQSTRDMNAYPPRYAGLIIDRFMSVFDLPEGSLSPLKQALELGEIDFTRLPLGEVPAFSLPYPEDDLIVLLFLLSKPYFSGMNDGTGSGDRDWEEGRCPVCSGRSSLVSVAGGNMRRFHCSFCGAAGHGTSAGCPVCLTSDPAKQGLLMFEGEEGFSVHTCGVCVSYVKIIEEDILSNMTADLADLLSLPLDIVVQEKGFKRPSPNPLGMVRMSGKG
jgi:FdhE protein